MGVASSQALWLVQPQAEATGDVLVVVPELIPEAYWQPDRASQACSCGQPFTMIHRRHHCRVCGSVRCAACAPKTRFLELVAECVDDPATIATDSADEPLQDQSPISTVTPGAASGLGSTVSASESSASSGSPGASPYVARTVVCRACKSCLREHARPDMVVSRVAATVYARDGSQTPARGNRRIAARIEVKDKDIPRFVVEPVSFEALQAEFNVRQPESTAAAHTRASPATAPCLTGRHPEPGSSWRLGGSAASLASTGPHSGPARLSSRGKKHPLLLQDRQGCFWSVTAQESSRTRRRKSRVAAPSKSALADPVASPVGTAEAAAALVARARASRGLASNLPRQSRAHAGSWGGGAVTSSSSSSSKKSGASGSTPPPSPSLSASDARGSRRSRSRRRRHLFQGPGGTDVTAASSEGVAARFARSSGTHSKQQELQRSTSNTSTTTSSDGKAAQPQQTHVNPLDSPPSTATDVFIETDSGPLRVRLYSADASEGERLPSPAIPMRQPSSRRRAAGRGFAVGGENGRGGENAWHERRRQELEAAAAAAATAAAVRATFLGGVVSGVAGGYDGEDDVSAPPTTRAGNTDAGAAGIAGYGDDYDDEAAANRSLAAANAAAISAAAATSPHDAAAATSAAAAGQPALVDFGPRSFGSLNRRHGSEPCNLHLLHSPSALQDRGTAGLEPPEAALADALLFGEDPDDATSQPQQQLGGGALDPFAAAAEATTQQPVAAADPFAAAAEATTQQPVAAADPFAAAAEATAQFVAHRIHIHHHYHQQQQTSSSSHPLVAAAIGTPPTHQALSRGNSSRLIGITAPQPTAPQTTTAAAVAATASSASGSGPMLRLTVRSPNAGDAASIAGTPDSGRALALRSPLHRSPSALLRQQRSQFALASADPFAAAAAAASADPFAAAAATYSQSQNAAEPVPVSSSSSAAAAAAAGVVAHAQPLHPAPSATVTASERSPSISTRHRFRATCSVFTTAASTTTTTAAAAAVAVPTFAPARDGFEASPSSPGLTASTAPPNDSDGRSPFPPTTRSPALPSPHAEPHEQTARPIRRVVSADDVSLSALATALSGATLQGHDSGAAVHMGSGSTAAPTSGHMHHHHYTATAADLRSTHVPATSAALGRTASALPPRAPHSRDARVRSALSSPRHGHPSSGTPAATAAAARALAGFPSTGALSREQFSAPVRRGSSAHSTAASSSLLLFMTHECRHCGSRIGFQDFERECAAMQGFCSEDCRTMHELRLAPSHGIIT